MSQSYLEIRRARADTKQESKTGLMPLSCGRVGGGNADVVGSINVDPHGVQKSKAVTMPSDGRHLSTKVTVTRTFALKHSNTSRRRGIGEGEFHRETALTAQLVCVDSDTTIEHGLQPVVLG